MKIGVSISMDVTKIDKARLHKGAKGTYLDVTTFIDLDNKDQYGNNGFVAHSKKEGEQGNTPILGNTKVFWSDGDQAPQQHAPRQNNQQPAQTSYAQQQANAMDDDKDKIPF